MAIMSELMDRLKTLMSLTPSEKHGMLWQLAAEHGELFDQMAETALQLRKRRDGGHHEGAPS